MPTEQTVIQMSDVAISVSGPNGPAIIGGHQSGRLTIRTPFEAYMESGEQIPRYLPKPDVEISGTLGRGWQDPDSWARIYGGDGSIKRGSGQELVPPDLSITFTANSPAKGLVNRRVRVSGVKITERSLDVGTGRAAVGEGTTFVATTFEPL